MAWAVVGAARVQDAEHVQRLLAGTGYHGGPLFRFANRSSSFTFPLGEEQVGSCFHPLPAGFFDGVVVDGDLPLFRSTMTLDLLARLHDSLRPGGTLHVQQRSLTAGGDRLRLGLDELRALFGEVQVEDGLVTVRRAAADLGGGRSVLSAFWAHQGELILEDLFGGSIWNADEAHAGAYFDPLVEDAGRAASRRLRPRRTSLVSIVERYRRGELRDAPEDPEAIESHEPTWRFAETPEGFQGRISSWMNYRMWGVFYKAPLYAAVLRELFGDPGRPLDLIEHGGDVGLVPLQVLLEPGLDVRSVVNAEISSAVLFAGKRLHDHLGDRVAGRYRYAIGPSEQYAYDRPVDVVTFTHCLLYLRRDLLEGSLRSAFEHLRPGGALLVLENTSPPTTSGGKDGDIIFAPDELDELLGRVAPVRSYRVKDGQPCPPEDRASTPVLRVLVKP